jgi:hypothetical protein
MQGAAGHRYRLTTREGQYVVTSMRLPAAVQPGHEAPFFDKARDEMVAQGHGTVIREAPLELSGYVGRQLDLLTPGTPASVLRSRTYLVSSQLYQLVVVQPDTSKEEAGVRRYYDDLADKFFTSFKLLR